jgi:hypothetical protein
MSPNPTDQTTGMGTTPTTESTTSEILHRTDIGEYYGVDNRIWLGIAAGAAIGIGLALSRRRPASRWEMARERLDRAKGVASRVAEEREDFAETGRDLLDRVRLIYEESRKVVDEMGHLWEHGRKLVRSA